MDWIIAGLLPYPLFLDFDSSPSICTPSCRSRFFLLIPKSSAICVCRFVSLDPPSFLGGRSGGRSGVSSRCQEETFQYMQPSVDLQCRLPITSFSPSGSRWSGHARLRAGCTFSGSLDSPLPPRFGRFLAHNFNPRSGNGCSPPPPKRSMPLFIHFEGLRFFF